MMLLSCQQPIVEILICMCLSDLGVQLKPREILPINACSPYMKILKSIHIKENTQNGVGINCCIEEQTQFTVNRTAL